MVFKTAHTEQNGHRSSLWSPGEESHVTYQDKLYACIQELDTAKGYSCIQLKNVTRLYRSEHKLKSVNFSSTDRRHHL